VSSSITLMPSLIAPLSDWEESKTPVQFEWNGKRFAVGGLVAEQRLASFKGLNLNVHDEMFEVLLVAAVVRAGLRGALNLVCGFPKSTFHTNREALLRLREKEYNVTTPEKSFSFKLSGLWPLYESQGHAVGLRETEKLTGNLLCLSVGFGTVEGIFLKADGQSVSKSLFSSPLGIREAVRIFQDSLLKAGIREPDGGGDESWYDRLLLSAYRGEGERIVQLSGQRALSADELRGHALQALEKYASKLALKVQIYLDAQSSENCLVALTGGGIRYAPVEKALQTIVAQRHLACQSFVSASLTTAVEGYACIATSEPRFRKKALAVDFGNANIALKVMGE
jgi:hypothetical protein